MGLKMILARGESWVKMYLKERIYKLTMHITKDHLCKPGGSCVLATNKPRAKLSIGHQKVDVIGSNIVLCEANDCAQ